MTPPACRHRRTEPRRARTAQVADWCLDCGQWATQWLSNDALAERGLSRHTLPYAPGYAPDTPCQRCQVTAELEIHHIAPRAVFGDVVADEFGTVDLCRPCHEFLHQRLTPGLCTTYDVVWHVQLITLTVPPEHHPTLALALAEQLPQTHLKQHIDTLFRRLMRWMDEAA